MELQRVETAAQRHVVAAPVRLPVIEQSAVFRMREVRSVCDRSAIVFIVVWHIWASKSKICLIGFQKKLVAKRRAASCI
jgi:hypothetical protein